MLMHILLNEVVSVSLLACMPIITAILSNSIDPTQTFLLGIFQFSQLLLTV
ncbi:hypothetical protein I4U23_010537 [Adineta vaga]|nr:hypothetical protein I4U23_010537 [Adineta vaga]